MNLLTVDARHFGCSPGGESGGGIFPMFRFRTNSRGWHAIASANSCCVISRSMIGGTTTGFFSAFFSGFTFACFVVASLTFHLRFLGQQR